MTSLDLPDGYYAIPAGKLVSVVTQLEMRGPPERTLQPLPEPWRLEPLRGESSLSAYRALFNAVGEEWLWFSRRVMGDAELVDLLDHPRIDCWALSDGQEQAGMLELDFRDETSCELAFLGLRREHQGLGLGRALIDEGIRRAFEKNIDRLWVHTCTHDGPQALPFYMRSGFIPFGRQIEVHDDYRLSGILPASAAPHVPLLNAGKARP